MRKILLFFLLLAPMLQASTTLTSAGAISSGKPLYDEQLILVFTQTFTDISFNVTAVSQCGTEGMGIGYFLNGLSNAGYWYQVGLSWRWPYLTNSSLYPTRPGFDANYEVFSSNGSSLHIGGRGPLLQSVAVDPGDTVLLRMRYLSGNVSLSLHDWNTDYLTETSYGAYGAGTFVTTGNSPTDHHGFFTGLMTEQYHGGPYYGDEKQATFSTLGQGLSSGWMRIDEFHVPYNQYSGFDEYSLVNYSNPGQTLNFTLNGAFESSNANEFITGGSTSGFNCPQSLGAILLQRYWYIIPIVVSAVTAVIFIAILKWRRSQTSPYLQAEPPPVPPVSHAPPLPR